MERHGVKGLTLVFALVVAVLLGVPGWAQEKAKASAPTQEMAISRAVLATGVENREPAGSGEAFPASTEKVYCFIEATHIGKDTEVSLIWLYGNKEMRKMNLPLKAGPKWRTWAHKNLGGQKGDWKVEIKDAEGKLLKEVKFKVE